MPKYLNDEKAILESELYSEILEKKGLKYLTIRRTADFDNLKGLNVDIKAEYTWSYGDNLIKLSNKFYGTSAHWWVIGFVNKKPTDSHFKIGDIVYIPSSPYLVTERLR